MTHEIITVQIGNASNHVGAHWWNIQESSFIFDANEVKSDPTRLNHDVMFREGQDINMKLHYTPRLILIDAKENIGSTCMLHCLKPSFNEKVELESPLWSGATACVNKSLNQKNEFLKDLENSYISEKRQKDDKMYHLDDHVTTWTDFLRVPYHPKSVLPLNDISTNCISDFEIGRNLTENVHFRDEIEEKFRFYGEECDALQGFHLLVDIHDAFSGVNSTVLEYIREEFPRCAIFCCPTVPETLFLQEKFNRTQFFWNCAKSIDDLATECNLVVPLSLVNNWQKPHVDFRQFDHLHYKTNLLYHTSAIMALALESISSFWRLSNTSYNLNDCCSLLNINNRKLTFLSTLAPYSFEKKEPNFTLLSPNIEQKIENFDQYKKSLIAVRGVKNLLTDTKQSIKDRMIKAYEKIDLPDENYELNVAYEPVYTKTPFPHIFSKFIDENGRILNNKRTISNGVKSIPILCQMESSSRCLPFLNVILHELENMVKKKPGLDYSTFSDMRENLHSLKENY